MKKSLRFGTVTLAFAAILTILFTLNIPSVKAEDNNGPTNYCIPGPEMMGANEAIFGRTDVWCYAVYLKAVSTYYDYYFTEPIKEVSIIETASGEVKMNRQSYGDGGMGMGAFEGCYKYTGARAEMSPGETYNIKTVVENNYYSYNGTNYCAYNYSATFVFRIFIDFNANGIFEHATEWINSPTKISSGATKIIGATPASYRYDAVANCSNRTLEYQITIPDNQPTTTTRMRILNAYYYPYATYNANIAQTLDQPGNACWNGYAYDYTAYYGGWYGYNYGEIEDYLIDFTLPFKGSFPDSKAPDDILLAGQAYDGTTRIVSGVPTDFKRPFVKFGNPMPAGSILTYTILGPLPETNIIYQGVDPVTNSTSINVGVDKIGTNVVYEIQKAAGPAATSNPAYGFKWLNGGEYQLVLGLGKDINNMKYQKKNFNVSWEWDISAIEINEPLSSGPPRYHKYPRGLELSLKAVVQNVGMRGISKFDVYFRVYNSKGNLVVERVVHWDANDFGKYVVAGKQKVNLDFGTWKTTLTDTYTATVTVDLLSATDMEPYNNTFRRSDQPAYEFSVKDEIEAAAREINIPAEGSQFIAGRPFIPMVTLSNEGVGDISNTPTRLTIRELSTNTIVYNELIMVEDIPQGRYNLKQAIFPQTAMMKPGEYEATLKVSHPDDMEASNDVITRKFSVIKGLLGKFTIGTKYLGNSNNFKTIDDAMDMLYLKGINSSVVFEFTDAEYTVSSRTSGTPAWDLTTAIMGLGYNKLSGEYWTITFKPSEDRLVTRASVKINLNSEDGKGVAFGQSLMCSNPNSVQAENSGNKYYVPYSNSGGYITFDGGANKSFRFVLNSKKDAFGAVFYLGAGSRNITIKNVIMENNKLAIANKVKLPNAHYSVVDGFLFTPNTELTESGWVGYSAGIVNRCEILGLKTEKIVIALDTMANKNNLLIGNDINGFGYGIVSLGIGVLRDSRLQEFAPFYNENTLIENNKIYNVSGAGVYVGNEKLAKVKSNVIFDVKGDGGPVGAGIIAGGNATVNMFGYNNYQLNLDGNSISNVRGNVSVYGILVDQDANKYLNGDKYKTFPPVNDDINVMNNAIWNIKALNTNTQRAGIHLLTQRDLKISDFNTRNVTPNYTDYFIRNSVIANNTVLITEDGITNNNNIVGLAIQQAKGLRILNNAISVSDQTIGSSNEVAAGVFYEGDYPLNDGIYSDKNAFWFGSANVAPYRHVYTDYKARIIETGSRNEYRQLTQWQMAAKSDLHSVINGNFVNDYYFVGTYPEEMKIRTNVKGSVLTRRGDRIPEVTNDIYGNTRGVAGGRYDIGAVEGNGPLYNNDAEMLVITDPGTYRATDGIFSDAEYLMTNAPIEVKANVRNSGNIPMFNKKVFLNIYRELPNGTFSLAFGPIERSVDIEATDYLTVNFNVADGIGNDFVPQTYNDLKSYGYNVPVTFAGMEANVTPLYKITVTTDPDEVNMNNSVSKISRFYILRSEVKFLVSNKAAFKTSSPTTEELAYGLNYDKVKQGMELIGWKIDLANNRYDYDLFNRAGWEPRNVDYRIYRTMLWSDGNNNTLTRLEKLNMTEFINAGIVGDNKNLIIGSEEMVRNNVNVDDADEVFVKNILRAEYRFPGNPLGADGNYDGFNLKGVSVGRDLTFSVKSTGVAGDMYPKPGLMNIVNTGYGISRPAFTFNKVQNPEWTDEARIAGITTNTLKSSTVYLAIDWRHFTDIEKTLRASFDVIEASGGTVIPVELLSFNAKEAGKRVDISWTTASELNSSRFDVEKSSANSGIFTKIAELDAAGNSSVIRNYGPVIDNNVEYGQTYIYRLVTVDKNGQTSTSDERTITLTGLNGYANLNPALPHPVTSESTMGYYLSENSNIEITLIDASGKVVLNLYNGTQTAGDHQITINAKDLTSGVYQVVLRSGDFMQSRSINVVK